ncbi:MAG: hypothetical protein H7833_21330, partial [Magnetococcus sp. DMHC-1]
MSSLRRHLPSTISWIDDRGSPAPERFAADLDTERSALQHGVALVDLSHGGIVTLSGVDRGSFLGGLITNQIKDVSASRSIYTAMLTPQGRFLWDFTIVDAGDRLHLLTEPDRVPQLMERLAMY